MEGQLNTQLQIQESVRRQYEAMFQDVAIMHASVTEFAVLGLKSLLIAQGGALVALLTFVGNFRSFALRVDLLGNSFWAFTAGFVLALLSTVIAYVSAGYGHEMAANAVQRFRASLEGRDYRQYEHDEDTARSRGLWSARAALAIALISVVLFPLGIWFGLSAVLPLGDL